MPLSYSQPDIKEAANKPAALPNNGYPYSALDDRRFEELLYSIGRQRIEEGDWKGRFDEINLLEGVKRTRAGLQLAFGW